MSALKSYAPWNVEIHSSFHIDSYLFIFCSGPKRKSPPLEIPKTDHRQVARKVVRAVKANGTQRRDLRQGRKVREVRKAMVGKEDDDRRV